MAKTYRQLEQDFKAGRNVKENFELLKNEISNCYFSLAGMELNMNYYSLSERFNSAEKKGSLDGLFGVSDMRYTLEKCIDAFYNAGLCDDTVKKLTTLRENIISTTKTVLSYADSFQLYEYALNRAITAYEENLSDIDNEPVARELLGLIFKGDDNFVINENIKLMVQMLPVRMTKNKFFDICHDALAEYVGAPKDAFLKMLYFIRSGSGLVEFDGTDKNFENMYNIYEEFDRADYGRLDRETLVTMSERLKLMVRSSMDAVEAMRGIEEIANELLVIFKTLSHADEETKASIYSLKSIYDEALGFFASTIEPLMSDNVTTLFTAVEGKLEAAVENMERLEMLVESVKGMSELSEDSYISDLMDCRKLMSSSLFVELEEEDQSEELDEASFEKEFSQLRDDFQRTFKDSSRLLIRARMAYAMYQLPVFFKNRTEVMNYLLGSLAACDDKAEKLVSVRTLIDVLRDPEYHLE